MLKMMEADSPQNDTMANMLKMMEGEKDVDKPKKKLRTSSDDRFVNHDYQDKQEAKMLEGMMAAMGMTKEELDQIKS